MNWKRFLAALFIFGGAAGCAWAQTDSYPSGARTDAQQLTPGGPAIGAVTLDFYDSLLAVPGLCSVSQSCPLPVRIVQPVASATTTDFPVTIGTASTQLIAASTNGRVRVTVVNESTVSGNDVFCRSDGGTAALNTGIDLAPNKGGYEWIYPLTGNLAINCIAVSAAAVVSVEAVQ